MKKDILSKGILIPFCIGIVVTIAVFCTFLGMRNFIPVNNNTAIAYFDNGEDNKSNNIDASTQLKENQIIGDLYFSEIKLNIRYKSEYSDMANSVSVVDGSLFDKAGICYIEVLKNLIPNVETQNAIVTVGNDSNRYRYVETISANNRNDIMLYNGKVKKGIVLFYQKTEQYGFSSKYEAMVFEEVQ